MERSSKYHHPQKKRKSDIRRVRDRICKIATKFAVMGFEKKSKPHLEKVKKKELYKECSETAGKLLKPSPIDLSNYVPLDDADFGCSSSFNVLAEIVKTAAHSEPVIELNESNVADASDKSKSRNEFDDFIPLVNIDSRSSTTGLTDSEAYDSLEDDLSSDSGSEEACNQALNNVTEWNCDAACVPLRVAAKEGNDDRSVSRISVKSCQESEFTRDDVIEILSCDNESDRTGSVENIIALDDDNDLWNSNCRNLDATIVLDSDKEDSSHTKEEPSTSDSRNNIGLSTKEVKQTTSSESQVASASTSVICRLFSKSSLAGKSESEQMACLKLYASSAAHRTYRSFCLTQFSSYRYQLLQPLPHPQPLSAEPVATDTEPHTFVDVLSRNTFNRFNRLIRSWNVLQKFPEDHQPLRICSYNVLCQETIWRTLYLYEHLKGLKFESSPLDWNERSRLLAVELPLIDADVLCLQEVQLNHFSEFFLPLLKSIGYNGLYKKRTRSQPDGCAVFYKTKRLELKGYNPVEYYVSQSCVLNRDNVGQIARFRFKKSQKEFCVANTHLLFNKRRGDVKMAQLAVLLASLDRECGPGSERECPAVMCGDFNISPYCPIYDFIMRGRISFDGLTQHVMSGQGEVGGRLMHHSILPQEMRIRRDCRFWEVQKSPRQPQKSEWTHPWEFASSYFHVTSSQEAEVSTCSSADSGNPDFIFYTVDNKRVDVSLLGGPQNCEVIEGRLKLIQRLSLPSFSLIEGTFGPWPNSATPSDHIPLIVDFALSSK